MAHAEVFAEFPNLGDDDKEVIDFPDYINTVLYRLNYSAPKVVQYPQSLDVTISIGLHIIFNIILKTHSAKLAGPLSPFFWLCFSSGTFPRR